MPVLQEPAAVGARLAEIADKVLGGDNRTPGSELAAVVLYGAVFLDVVHG